MNLQNSPRIHELMRAGNLYLSLQDALALAIENNLDIELQRYRLPNGGCRTAARAGRRHAARAELTPWPKCPPGVGGPLSPW